MDQHCQIAPLVIILTVCCIFSSNPLVSGDELMFVQAIWRHGARAPSRTYKNDVHQVNAWPTGWGQLLETGIHQQFELGRRLRQRYVHEHRLLSPDYHTDEIYVRSTDMDRTLQSAMANLAGFYSEDDDKVPKFTPVPIHTIPLEQDRYRVKTACERLNLIWNIVFTESPESKQVYAENQELFAKLSEWCGEDVGFMNGTTPVWVVEDATAVEEENNMTLPKWATQEVREKLGEMLSTIHRWENGRGLAPYRGVDFAREMPILRGGPILWDIIENMEAKLHCSQYKNASSDGPSMCSTRQCSALAGDKCKWLRDRRYFAYSAHDVTLTALLTTLGFESNVHMPTHPRYAATVLFELWRRGSAHHGKAKIRAHRRRRGTDELEPLKPSSEEQHEEEFYVKVLYWPGVNDPTHRGVSELDLTKRIDGCEHEKADVPGCSMLQFVQRSERYRADSIEEFCQETNLDEPLKLPPVPSTIALAQKESMNAANTP